MLNFNARFIAVPMMKVQTVAGMLTNLPCNITPSGEIQLLVFKYRYEFEYIFEEEEKINTCID